MFDWRNRTGSFERFRASGLLLSLLGNVLLAGAVTWSLWSRQNPAAVATSAMQAGARQSVIPPAEAHWDWSRVQSVDDAVYARNLRALGLPEANVVDLIVGEITTRYAERWRSEPGAQLAYWQSADVAIASERARSRARLERERRAAIQRALGAAALLSLAKYQLWNEADTKSLWLDFLPEEKRERLSAIYSRYAEAGDKDPALLTEAEVREAAANDARQRAEITALLSPRELEDLELRQSETADRLRQELRGFAATETEFRQLFRVRRAYEATILSNTDVRDPNVLQVRIEAERRFSEEARAALGEQRYADYQRVRDPDFQNALQISRYRGLPADTAARIYELKRSVDARVTGITFNPAFPEQRQRDLLGQIQSETEGTLRSLLGAEALAEYRRNNRWWRFDE